MVYCCVLRCTHQSKVSKKIFEKTGKNVTFHRLPREKELRRKWMRAIRRDERHCEAPIHATVCSFHFKEGDIRKSLAGKRSVKDGVVPSVFSWANKEKPPRKPFKRPNNLAKKQMIENTNDITENYPLSDHSYCKSFQDAMGNKTDSNEKEENSGIEDSTQEVKVEIITKNVTRFFKCDTCGKCFSNLPLLISHLKIHAGEFPYKCDICSKCFSHDSVLKHHLRTHSEKQTLKCENQSNIKVEENVVENETNHVTDETKWNDVKRETCFDDMAVEQSFKNQMNDVTENATKLDNCYGNLYQGTLEIIEIKPEIIVKEEIDDDMTMAQSIEKQTYGVGEEMAIQQFNENTTEVLTEWNKWNEIETELSVKKEVEDENDVTENYTESDTNNGNSFQDGLGTIEFEPETIVKEKIDGLGTSEFEPETIVKEEIDGLATIMFEPETIVKEKIDRLGTIEFEPETIVKEEIEEVVDMPFEKHCRDEPFKCDNCGHGFAKDTYLNRHIKSHCGPKVSPYTCQICGSGFSKSFTLKKHLLSHTEKGYFNCDICGLAFTQRQRFKKHLKIRHKEAFKIMKAQIKKRQKNKQGSKLSPYTCQICGSGFSKSLTLRKHILTHTEIRQHKCHICGLGFTGIRKLNKHMKYRHIEAFKKMRVEKRESKQGSMNVEEMATQQFTEYTTIYGAEKNKGNEIETATSVKEDMAFDDETESNTESDCNSFEDNGLATVEFEPEIIVKKEIDGLATVEFEQEVVVKEEIDGLATSEFEPEVVVKEEIDGLATSEFEQETIVKEEIDGLATGEFEPETIVREEIEEGVDMPLEKHCRDKPFKCDNCGHCFAKDTYLKRHIKGHCGPKVSPYTCQICGSGFSKSVTLKKHLLSHTEKGHFKCDICGLAFTKRQRFKKHLKIRHKEVFRIIKAQMKKREYKQQSNMNVEEMTTQQCTEKTTIYGAENNKGNEIETATSVKEDMAFENIENETENYTESDCNSFEDNGLATIEFEPETIVKEETDGLATVEFEPATTEINNVVDMPLKQHCGDKRFKCDNCGRDFTAKHGLKRHIKLHCGPKVSPYKCLICGSGFSKILTLQKHILTHTGKGRYKCYICRMAFTGRRQLNQHINRHKGSSKMMKTGTGERKNKLHSNFIVKEMATQQFTENTIYVAEKNKGNEIETETSVEGDMAFENETENYTESDCNSFEDNGLATVELEPATIVKEEIDGLATIEFEPETIVKEEIDGLATIEFEPATIVKEEIDGLATGELEPETIATDEIEEVVDMPLEMHYGDKRFKCDNCGRDFTAKKGLKKHIKLHCGPKVSPFPCLICWSGFSKSFTLKKHLLTHTQKVNYKCDICGLAFTQRQRFNRHLKRHKEAFKKMKAWREKRRNKQESNNNVKEMATQQPSENTTKHVVERHEGNEIETETSVKEDMAFEKILDGVSEKDTQSNHEIYSVQDILETNVM